ncbi:MAG: MMPL family transporter [Halioglobus sp.]|nr:MMPL family transporter [Halioglobus sp.]
MQGFIDFLVERRLVLALLTIVLGAWVGYGITFTDMDPRSDAILPEDDPYVDQIDAVEKDFPPSSSAVFTFIGPEGDIFNRATLSAMEALHERFGEVQSAVAVGSIVNHRLNAVDEDAYGREYLLPPVAALSDAELDQIRTIALADEDLTKTLLAKTGDMTLAVMKYRPGGDGLEERLDIARSILALRDSLREEFPGVEIYTIGSDLFELDSYNAARKDRTNLAPLVAGATTALLWLCLSSFVYSICVFAVSFISIALTIGAVGWLGYPFNQISNMGPLVVLTIAMADGIHIISVYLQNRHQGMEKKVAMRESLALNFQPVTLATVTTAMGFLSLNYCTSAGIYGFGNVVALGVIWAYVVTLTLLPAMVLLLPSKKVPRPLGVRRLMAGVGKLVAERGNALFWGSLVIIAITLAMLPLNKVDFDRYSFIDKESDFHKVITAMSEKIGNDQSLVYAIDSGKYYGIAEPEFLLELEKFSNWLEEQPEASFVNSYINLLKTLNKAENDSDEAFYVLPNDNLQVIDYLVTYQLIQEIEPHMEPIFDPEYDTTRLVVGTSNLTNGQLIAFNEKIEAWLAENLNPEYRVLQGSGSVVYARLNQTISKQLLEGFTLSFLLITLTMLVGLRSVRYGLLSIVPNLFPVTIVFGVWGLFVGELSPYILMLFSISIGLVVDDSVHVLSKYIAARRDGKSPEDAVQYSLDRAGSAITITTAALAMGTVILVFSNTYYYQNVALMLTPIIVVALLLDLLFLPPLLVKFDRWLEGRGISMAGAGKATA